VTATDERGTARAGRLGDRPPARARLVRPSPGPGARRRWLVGPADLLATAGYLLAALYVMAHLFVDPAHRVQRNNPNDQAFFEFVLAHAARLVTHGGNPFFTRQMNMPDGVNLMANTSILGLSLPLAPVTLLFGASVSYAVLCVLALAATATSWYALLARHLVGSRFAAFVGGWFCAFAPGVVAQANGHPNIVAQFLVPWIVWRALRLREPSRRWPNAIALALLVVWQFFINEEVLFLTAVGFGVVILVHLIWYRRGLADQVRPFLRGLAVSAGLVLVALSYPLWFQFFGPQHYRGLPPLIRNFGVDLWSYPSYSSEALAGNINTSYLFAPNPAEQNAFFGWALLLLVGLIVWRLRRSPLVVGLAAAAVTFALLSLGTRIVIRGHHTHLPGPWAVVSRLPLFDTVVAPRLALAVVPLLGVLLAIGCDRYLIWSAAPVDAPSAAAAVPAATADSAVPAVTADAAVPAATGDMTGPHRATTTAPRRPGASRGRPPFRLVGAAVLALALVPIAPTPLAAVEQTPVPGFITEHTYREYVPAGRSLVTVPLPRPPFVDALYFSAAVNLDFAFPRGYFLGPRVDPDHPDRVGAMYGAPFLPTSTLLERVAFTGVRPPVGPADRAQALTDLAFWRAAALLLPFDSNNEYPLYQTTSDLLGFRPVVVDGGWLWDVRGLVGTG